MGQPLRSQMLTEAHAQTTKKHRSMIKYYRGRMCTDAYRSTCTEVSTESMGVYGITCQYIYNKDTSVHRVTSMDDSAIKMTVQGKTNTYGEYGRDKPKHYIGMDVVGKVQKVVSYVDSVHQGSWVLIELYLSSHMGLKVLGRIYKSSMLDLCKIITIKLYKDILGVICVNFM